MALSEEDSYEYQALRTVATIRLVKIHPERVKGCIACEIYHFDGEEQNNIQYRALSYVWGDPQATRQIFLKGPDDRWRLFPLHENLWQFLNRAWELRLFDDLFWTDRLCLDQDNPEEISQQVPRMRTIYSHAELALIWLQLTEREEQCLLEILRRYDQDCTSDTRHGSRQKQSSLDHRTFWKLYTNPYWTRVWIVQEVVISRKACVACGESLIPVEKLASLFKSAWRDFNSHPMGIAASLDPSIWALCRARACGKQPLAAILARFIKYQSSRPVDRLYGMLGLVKDNDDGTSPTDNIQVDYGRPTLHAFLDAMFESTLEPKIYPHLRQCLGSGDNYDSYSLLKGYITHSKTMQRHKDLAKLALQALDACNILTSGRDAPDEEFLVRDTRNVSSLGERSRNVTLEQNAALLGVALARLSSGPLARWGSRGEVSSPWRCVMHRSIDMQSYEPFLIAGDLWADLGIDACVLETCAEASQNCDGPPSLCYEILQVGLRLRYEFYLYSTSQGYRDQGYFKIERRRSDI